MLGAVKRMPRVGIVGLWHETNTYSAHRTNLQDFEQFELATGPELIEINKGTGSVIGGFCDAEDFELVPIVSAGAWPNGLITSGTRRELFDRFARGLSAAGHLDGMLVNLHGAMVAEECDDVDAAVLRLIREHIGRVPTAAVVDLHANLAPAIVDGCDVLISYDTYPHIDMRERGREAAEFLAKILEGARLKTVIAKIPILATPLAQATAVDPMKGLQDRARKRATESGLERICIVGGFAYSDVERAGMSVLAVTDAAESEAARRVIAETVEDIRAHAAEFRLTRPRPAEAVRDAIRAASKPVVLADVGDNIGGGSPGDGTAVLAELMAQRAKGAVVLMADAEVARLAASRGVGAELSTRVGGKTDGMHGAPVAITGKVVSITDGNYETSGSWMTGRHFSMGTTVVLDVGGITLVVMERPTPPFHIEQLTSAGIDPRKAQIIALKGAIAWRAAYEGVAKTVIEVDSPGVCPVDPSVLPRKWSAIEA